MNIAAQKQQALFDKANKDLAESFYRHSPNPEEASRQLEAFKDGLSKVKPLPEKPKLKLYSVEEIKYTVLERAHWWSIKKTECVKYKYALVLDGEFVLEELYCIKEAYVKVNELNTFIKDEATAPIGKLYS